MKKFFKNIWVIISFLMMAPFLILFLLAKAFIILIGGVFVQPILPFPEKDWWVTSTIINSIYDKIE